MGGWECLYVIEIGEQDGLVSVAIHSHLIDKIRQRRCQWDDPPLFVPR